MYIQFNDQELDAMQALLDLAVKAGGMQVAEAGVVLSNKLKNGIADELVNIKQPKEDSKSS